MSARGETWLFLLQRASAAILAVAVAVHLATIVYAVQGGLSAAEILGRTRGHAGWLAFYLVFVVAVAIHGPIGMRAILREWTRWRGASLDAAIALMAVALTVFGAYAALSLFR